MRLVIVVLLGLTGCGSPCQQVKATRCNGSLVELCGSNQKWQRVLDCAQVKAFKAEAPAQWTCGEKDGKCTCVPVKP
jgi:hypothetical protein